jgi:predicted DNA-binding transcriptional regulator AlpA
MQNTPLDPEKQKTIARVARLFVDLMRSLELIEEPRVAKAPQTNGNLQQGLLSLEQVMELVPVSRATLHRMQKNGRFPTSKQIGPHRRAWRARDVFAWIDKDETALRRKRGGAKKKAFAAKRRGSSKTLSKKK